jgi:hypothetical protein
VKKILYVMTSLSHKRVFESFVVRPDCVQLALGPKAVATSGIVPEDYSDFKIDVKEYTGPKNIQKTVDEFKPNVYVQADLSAVHMSVKLPKGCKRVYVSHGMVGNHVKSIIKQAKFQTDVWKGCDLYCGGTSVFADWIKHVAKVGDDQILLNALPQLDIIHDSNYYNSYKQKVLSKTKLPNPDKVILFVGFCCKDRFDFDDHNQDYFGTAIHLVKWAEQNNHLIMIKPRHTYSEMIKFLESHAWGKHYIKEYKRIQSSPNAHFITTTGHIYRYFFADAIVVNGCSTVEIEACAIRKPLFLSRTAIPELNKMKMPHYDPYNTVTYRAAMGCVDYHELDHCLASCFKDGRYYWPEKQETLITQMGLTFDGQMHKRVQDKLVTL